MSMNLQQLPASVRELVTKHGEFVQQNGWLYFRNGMRMQFSDGGEQPLIWEPNEYFPYELGSGVMQFHNLKVKQLTRRLDQLRESFEEKVKVLQGGGNPMVDMDAMEAELVELRATLKTAQEERRDYFPIHDELCRNHVDFRPRINPDEDPAYKEFKAKQSAENTEKLQRYAKTLQKAKV